jgi:hypothetical protein
VGDDGLKAALDRLGTAVIGSRTRFVAHEA